jgi:hypothetical protein
MKSISLLILLTLSLFVKDSRTNEQFVRELEGKWVYSHTTNIYGDSFKVKFIYFSQLRYNLEFINKNKLTSKQYNHYISKDLGVFYKRLTPNPFMNLILIANDSLIKRPYSILINTNSNVNLASELSTKGSIFFAAYGSIFKEFYAIKKFQNDTLVFYDDAPSFIQVKDSLVNVYDFTRRAHPGKYNTSTLHYYVKVKK